MRKSIRLECGRIMKLKIIECDVCHTDITNARIRYKFKRRNNYFTQFYEPDPPEWTKLDMCERCFRELRQFIRNETINKKT